MLKQFETLNCNSFRFRFTSATLRNKHVKGIRSWNNRTKKEEKETSIDFYGDRDHQTDVFSEEMHEGKF